ncbi:nuclear RNA export factor 2-like [Meriones unguiculatus]|uniref:nuclear RNA export factor 2-like n=1 Tax=Meriones unguiculatus TaxID=10047 RepID=UPI00293EB464|nr:nuclear RNA export factor 2-like [Meriones unguiculatus]
MKKHYDMSQKSLYPRKLNFNPNLIDCGVNIFLNRRSCMTAILQIIQEEFPELLSLNLSNNKIHWLDGLSELIEKAPQIKILNLSRNWLKTEWELEKMKGLKLEELWLEDNPLCSTFPDHTRLSCPRQWSKILGNADVDIPSLPTYLWTNLLIILPSTPSLETLRKRRVARRGVIPESWDANVAFWGPGERSQYSVGGSYPDMGGRYYSIYDYGDRHNLLSAYHAEVCFSLTTAFHTDEADSSSLEVYFKDSRNIKKLKDSFLRMQLLKYWKSNIVTCLHELPKSQHDLNSYVVHFCTQTSLRLLFSFSSGKKMICFSINGVFKEVEGKSEGCIRAFTRIFILTSGRHNRLCIVNDEMILRNASPEETKKAFSTTMPTTSFTQSCCRKMKDSSTQTDSPPAAGLRDDLAAPTASRRRQADVVQSLSGGSPEALGAREERVSKSDSHLLITTLHVIKQASCPKCLASLESPPLSLLPVPDC